MLEQHSNRRTFPVDRHCGLAIAGVAADGRSVVNHAMSEATGYKCGGWRGQGRRQPGCCRHSSRRRRLDSCCAASAAS